MDPGTSAETITSLPIYTIHPGWNFRRKYSVLQLVQTQNGKIRKCTSINWKVQKEKKKNPLIKPICYNFWNVSNGMVRTILFSNQNFLVFRVNGKRPLSPLLKYMSWLNNCFSIRAGRTRITYQHTKLDDSVNKRTTVGSCWWDGHQNKLSQCDHNYRSNSHSYVRSDCLCIVRSLSQA